MRAPSDIIRAKRDGEALDGDLIRAFVDGVVDGRVEDAQIGAMMMAVFLRGMDAEEQVALTRAMRDSGRVLTWPDLAGPVLDKHSTGGVGDLVSLVLGPVLAACGAFVPMISGRGLGHTGGTLDKLESIPGYDTRPDPDVLERCVREVGVAIVGQGADLVPADRRLYAVRDVTATVESTPLIVASILSKKLAEGLDGLLIDVKTGSGAFMPDEASARALGEALVGVAAGSGLACEALITDMDAPLAASAGNALEVREAIDFLSGNDRHPRLDAVVRATCVRLLRIGGLSGDDAQAECRVSEALDSGAALERFAAMVRGLGGPATLCEAPGRHLPAAPVQRAVSSVRAGWIDRIDTQALGWAVVDLGGGRRRPSATVDPSVGLSALRSPGTEVVRGDPLAVVHAADEDAAEAAVATVRAAYRVAGEPPAASTMIHGRLVGAPGGD
jgi:thymidine phosphorylase